MLESMPYDERDEETGQFNPTYTPEDFINALREIDHEATTQEVKEEVGCAYRTTHERLSELEDSNEVQSRKLGSMLLWSLPDDNSHDSGN